MDADSLPVKVSSAVALYLYIRKEPCKRAFAEHLNHILERYLSIMDLIDHEELV